jgi:hypothetical protein
MHPEATMSAVAASTVTATAIEGQQFDEYLRRSSQSEESTSDEIMFFPKFLDGDTTFDPPLLDGDAAGVVLSSSSHSTDPAAAT